MPAPRDPVHPDARLPWSRAWERAAYGDAGFYSAGDGARGGPGRHFRTSVHVGAVFHRAIATLVTQIDERLAHPVRLDVVDVGAGNGELLSGILDSVTADLAERLAPVAIDVRPRPPLLDPRIGWIEGSAPDVIPPDVHGLLIAHEWLDDVPLDVAQIDGSGRMRLVLVDPLGRESLGPVLDDDTACGALGVDAASARSWLATWWPLATVGDRAEIGLPRDQCWHAAVGRLSAGTALAIDYGHDRAARASRRFAAGTLTAYRDGRVVPAAPDGRVNITAHVALDSVVARTGASRSSQRESLLELGVSAGLPVHDLALRDPVAYAEALVTASDSAELLDPAGLGGWCWIRLDR